MKLRPAIFILLISFSEICFSQASIVNTNPTGELVLQGNYNPALYTSLNPITHPDSIASQIVTNVSADSVHSWITHLSSFHNRNSGSDTLSNTKGIGAAQRWALGKFQQFSSENENRLLSGYIQFDRVFCSMTRHKDVYALLPGTDTSAKGVIIVEAHLDSRCEALCDTSCFAYGADDDGSGCALVIELARVLSKFSFKHSIMFVLNTGEEQGLYGAEALADYITSKGIKVKALLNNDIVAGIYCGNTASFPGCSPVGAVDTLNFRIYSFGGYNSPHKQLARFSKLEYKEQMAPLVGYASLLNIMSMEDRTGRGGDHIPFRQHGYTSIRFTSANEHGDGDPSQVGYDDRQHTSGDSMGVDIDFDQAIDSFYIDFNYLGRNTRVNANAIAMMGIGPRTPDFNVSGIDSGAVIDIITETQYGKYRVGVRTHTNDWDTVYTFTGTSTNLMGLNNDSTYIFSVASVDSLEVESLFSHETFLVISSNEESSDEKETIFMMNYPNPFEDVTMVTIQLPLGKKSERWCLEIFDGNLNCVKRIPVKPNPGIIEAPLQLDGLPQGIYMCFLVKDEIKVKSCKLVIQK